MSAGVEEHIRFGGEGGHQRRGSGVQPPEADFIECSLTLLYLTGQVIFNVTLSLINACNHG